MDLSAGLFPDSITLTDGTPVRQRDLGGYLLDFHKGVGNDDILPEILFVTFENRADKRIDANRLPWGFSFLRPAGYAVLGVKAKRADWYRDAALAAFFSGAAFADFIARYRRVIFYGGSMGGTGALALATPGATVLAISPQVTLDPALTPWETRYDEGRAFDWSGGPLSNYQAVTGAARAAKVYALYDPFDPRDLRHIALLPPATLQPLRLPFMGHGVPDWVIQTGVLQELVRLVAADELTPQVWRHLARRRRLTPDYAHRLGVTRVTPCVAQLCLNEGLRRWCEWADRDPGNIDLQMHVLQLLTEHKQVQAAQTVARRIQRLLDQQAV